MRPKARPSFAQTLGAPWAPVHRRADASGCPQFSPFYVSSPLGGVRNAEFSSALADHKGLRYHRFNGEFGARLLAQIVSDCGLAGTRLAVRASREPHFHRTAALLRSTTEMEVYRLTDRLIPASCRRITTAPSRGPSGGCCFRATAADRFRSSTWI